VRPVRVLWSQDVETQTRGYWAIAVALHRAGCEVVLGGAQTPAEVAEAATQEQVDVVGFRAMAERAAEQVEAVRAALAPLGRPGAAAPPLAAAGIFEADETERLRASGVREVFGILTPVEEIAERLRALGAEAQAAEQP
jgi:methylmalonyl-CoA mutase cobalamin-binding domain/chain